MSTDFSKTHAVVTGASSGIGRSVALALARAGAEKILIHYNANADGAAETSAMVEDIGCTAVIFSADLSNKDQVDELTERTFERLGIVHTWVNVAGADVLTGVARDMSFEEKLSLLLQVDVLGTIRLSRTVAERMAKQPTSDPSSMTFISWDQAVRGMEGDAGQMFGPVKAAINAFANSLAQTVAPRVRVNTIAPGWIQTKWGESTSEYWDARAKTQSLMHRWGTPEDIARAVVFAADPANTFLTGQTIDINGGWSRIPTIQFKPDS